MRNPVSNFTYVSSDIGMGRTKMDRNFDLKMTMSAGKLYPFFLDEVLPGDTFSIDTATFFRMTTPIHPVMDNCYLDTFFFFVPNRIVWDHWKEFMGESPSDPYINPIEYSVPQLIPFPNDTIDEAQGVVPFKSLLDYITIPAATCPKSINALSVRAFCKIWNEWFRDQNLQHAINLNTGDANLYYSNTGNAERGAYYWNNNEYGDYYIENTARGGDLPPVNKYHDYFTSALKEPQKGAPVPIPLSGFAPVYATSLVDTDGIANKTNETQVEIRKANGQSIGTSILGTINSRMAAFGGAGLTSQNTMLEFNNLGADLSNIAGVYATINDLRHAFQLQKFLEADNRGGTRYREQLKAHFGVTSPDASLQIPEFLGGKRIPINMSQVLQTSATNDVSPQGNTAAYSLTTDKYSSFTKSFTEHGHIIGVCCVRTMHTYSQGVDKMFMRKSKYDYYFPEFANISNQPIYTSELYIPKYPRDLSVNYDEDQIFGYQEAWAEYRYKPNKLTGEFSPNYPQTLASWHYGDYYTETPYLSSEWIAETRENIDRTLAVQSELADQFLANFYFDMSTTRIMPLQSIPGLADHH